MDIEGHLLHQSFPAQTFHIVVTLNKYFRKDCVINRSYLGTVGSRAVVHAQEKDSVDLGILLCCTVHFHSAGEQNTILE